MNKCRLRTASTTTGTIPSQSSSSHCSTTPQCWTLPMAKSSKIWAIRRHSDISHLRWRGKRKNRRRTSISFQIGKNHSDVHQNRTTNGLDKTKATLTRWLTNRMANWFKRFFGRRERNTPSISRVSARIICKNWIALPTAIANSLSRSIHIMAGPLGPRASLFCSLLFWNTSINQTTLVRRYSKSTKVCSVRRHFQILEFIHQISNIWDADNTYIISQWAKRAPSMEYS